MENVRKSKKKPVIIIVVILIVLAIAGGFAFLKWRGSETAGSLPVVQNAAGAEGANLATPQAAADADPQTLGFETKISLDGTEQEGTFSRTEPIEFGAGDAYTDMEGIITFRGDNYRDAASYGSPNITAGNFAKDHWKVETGSMEKGDQTKDKGSDEWSGSGWTGQPLIVQWDEQTKQIMNLYEDKKAKAGLVEAIYATMDGNVYFIDIEDGTPTRDPLVIGLPFKGAGALDPRGIPMLFVGAGDSLPEESHGAEGNARVFIYSLIDCTRLYEFGAKDDFAHRIFHAFDSSVLVDAETDTLLYPGENGVLYTMKLNTQYDPAAGTLSINPSEQVKWTYTNNRLGEDDQSVYWYGMEDSAAVWEHYMFIADNGGDLMCLDLNSMALVWAQDTKDDTNGSPVFEEDADGNKFLYVAPSLRAQKDAKTGTGEISIYKVNAMTGDIVWEKPYEVHSVSGISGGVQATAVVGKGEIDDLVIVPVSRTPYKRTGLLVALDKQTGEERWVYEMKNYAWSSPVAVYAADGTAYIVQCDSKGNMHLLNGKTGEHLDSVNMGANIEASPAVFGDTVVVGTRGKQIVGVQIQ